MVEIARLFEAESEHKIVVSYGASGKLFAQIINGAPIDVFLSADQVKPQKLIDTKKPQQTTQINSAANKYQKQKY